MKKSEWFTAYRYVVPEAYESWFEDQAAEGWHPEKIRQFSSMRMVMEKGDAKKYKYAVELLGGLSPERKALYTDFGWEYVGRMSNVFVWRKEYTDKRPEMFSDRPTAEKRTRRFSAAISVSLGIFLFGFVIGLVLLLRKLLGQISYEWLDIIIMLAVYGGASALLLTVVRKLKKKPM